MSNLEINGLSQKILFAYQKLLSLKRATVLELAKASGEDRANLYRYLDSLISKRLVSEVYENKKHYYIAEPPEALQKFIAAEKAKIDSIIPGLKALEKEALDRPKVRFFEGKEGIKTIYDELLEERSEMLAFAWPEKILDAIDFHDELLVKRRLKYKIFARVIYPDTKAAHRRDTGLKEARYSKHVPPFDAVYLISGNKTAMFSLKRWITGVLIENREITQGLRALFETLWAELDTKK
ncbi:MAG TPA: helix-turn-helix domain-containing protein [bacterium]|nr:helix-turn-helix domain-containing protein [bacterium]